MKKYAQEIALFYYFAFLNERMATESASSAFQLFRTRVRARISQNQKRQKKMTKNEIDSDLSEAEKNSILVSCTYSIWRLHKKNQLSKRLFSNPALDKWPLPSRASIEPWREFLRVADSDEQVLFLIWANILKISIKDISEGLSLSEGTIRFRLNRCLQDLSDFVYFGNNNAGIMQQ